MDPEDYPALLVDAAALWDITASEGSEELIQTATAALVSDVDTPSLRILAGESGAALYWSLKPLVEATLDELGRQYPQGEARQVAALRAMCRRLQRGVIDEQGLAFWVLHAIGWDGTREARELLELRSAYLEVEALGLDREVLDADVRREAQRLLGVA